jgi:hypothetical protein
MKNKEHCFVNHIYPRKLYVVITDSALFLNQHFTNRECDKGISQEEFDNNKAITFRCTYYVNGDYGVCVAFHKKEYMTVREIAHEALHVATAIHKDLGGSNSHISSFFFLQIKTIKSNDVSFINKNWRSPTI